MPSLLHTLTAAVALALAGAGRLPVACAELDAVCEAGIDQVFAEVAADSTAAQIAPGGCDSSAAFALCDVHGFGGVCRDEPECTPDITQINDDCTADNENNGCCAKLYHKTCADCEPEVLSCGQFCSDTPIAPYVGEDSSEGSTPSEGADDADPADPDAAADGTASLPPTLGSGPTLEVSGGTASPRGSAGTAAVAAVCIAACGAIMVAAL